MKRKTVGCLSIAIALPVLLFVFTFFFNPQCCHDYMRCESNMRRIYSSLHEYAKEHDRKYPEQLADLHPKYVDLREARCTMCRAERDSLETGYHYIPGLGLDDDKREPVLFCKRYHLSGHDPGSYSAQFGILLNDYTVVHARDQDLRKYDGPMRRYFLFFRRHPYDGSKPTLELVRSLKPRFLEESRQFIWIDAQGEDDHEEESPPDTS